MNVNNNAKNNNTNEAKSGFWMINRELKLICNMPSLFVLILIYPLCIGLVLFSLFYKESITQLPIAIIDQDHSVFSRNLVQKISAVPEVKIEKYYSDLAEAKVGLMTGDVFGIILVPSLFEQDLLANKQPEVTTFYNNQFMTIGSTLNRSIYAGLSGLISDIQLNKMAAGNIPSVLAKTKLRPIDVELRALFNPTLNFIHTLLNGVYPTILQIMIMLAITASMHAEREKNRSLGHLYRLANYRIGSFIFNKCITYFMIFFGFLFIFDVVMISYFNLPIRGNILLLLIGDAEFVLASLLFALALSMLISDKLRNYSAVGVLSSPAFGFTGLTFPKLVMNTFSYAWGCILPITWYIEIRLDQSLRGVSMLDSFTPFGYLAVIIITSLAIIGYKFKMGRSQGRASC